MISGIQAMWYDQFGRITIAKLSHKVDSGNSPTHSQRALTGRPKRQRVWTDRGREDAIKTGNRNCTNVISSAHRVSCKRRLHLTLLRRLPEVERTRKAGCVSNTSNGGAHRLYWKSGGIFFTGCHRWLFAALWRRSWPRTNSFDVSSWTV